MPDPPLEPERERLHKLIDGYIDKSAEWDDDYVSSDARVNAAMIVTIINWESEDGDTHEMPIMFSETKNIYSQIGILRVALATLEEMYTP